MQIGKFSFCSFLGIAYNIDMNTKQFLRDHAVYQIYPISFCDGNKDGYGDLKGLISKLDYLSDIGIHTIWLSPIYESPMVDFGYDISDYRKINPLFGTMDDFDDLMKETEKRGMKVIMDLVINHTSDKHEWFQKALEDKNSPYRDYYYFMEGRKDEKGNYTYPNNWTSNFTGPAWEEVPGEKGTYYLHIFTKEQVDLNWHNPQVLKEVEDIISFWMDKGVYGFRCDVISEIYKESFEDGTTKKPISQPIGMEHYLATKGNHDILKKIQKDVIEPRGGVLIGECGGNITIDDGKKFLDGELDTFFEFDIANCYKGFFSYKINPKKFKKILISWIKEIDWSGNYIENHDLRRVFDRYVYGKNEDQGAKMVLGLQFSLRGTPFIYMGQEYGAHNYPKPLPLSECKDIVTHNVYKMAKDMHVPNFLARHMAHKYGRDDERAPMAFNEAKGHGFTSDEVKPWQRHNPYSDTYNAKRQDQNGILSFFKEINQIRENNQILIDGSIDFSLDEFNQKDVLCFVREKDGKKILALMNLSNKKRRISKQLQSLEKELLISNYKEQSNTLRPYEFLLFNLR
jgi:oligo-1,6-glucosidase